MGFQYLMSDEGLYLRRQLLLALTEDERLHTAEVQRLWGLIKDEIKPQQIFSVAINAIRDFSFTGVTTLISQTPAGSSR
jgi:hypothetical protein